MFQIVSELVHRERVAQQAGHRHPRRPGQGRDGGRDPRAKVPTPARRRIVCRSGDPMDPADLDLVEPARRPQHRRARAGGLRRPRHRRHQDHARHHQQPAPQSRQVPHRRRAAGQDNMETAQLVGRDEARWVLGTDLIAASPCRPAASPASRSSTPSCWTSTATRSTSPSSPRSPAGPTPRRSSHFDDCAVIGILHAGRGEA